MIFSILSLVLLFNACSSVEETTIKTKHSTVLIMPFSYTEKYPFKFDQERKSVSWAFESYGFVVNETESVWNKIEESNLRLSELHEADVYKMADIAQSDLIIYRAKGGLRVFDCKKKTLVTYQSDYEVTPINYQSLVTRLAGIGY
jgi:hypothetical protein